MFWAENNLGMSETTQECLVYILGKVGQKSKSQLKGELQSLSTATDSQSWGSQFESPGILIQWILVNVALLKEVIFLLTFSEYDTTDGASVPKLSWCAATFTF